MNNDNENQSVTAEQGLVAMLNKSDIEQQITTAHKFPRSIRNFVAKATELVTLNEETADDCIYALPRFDKESGENKAIEGPSVRFAEIIAHSWGNSRSGARVIEEGEKFVTSQGVFHDLETNVAVTFHVQRRITGKNGRRYNDDMVGVTGNAASAIAYRNAVLKGIPKALWQPIYDQARKLLLGDVRTLSSRRDQMLAYYQKLGVSSDKVFELLEIQGVEDMTLEHLLTLRGLATAIKDGEATIEAAFKLGERKKAGALNEKLKGDGEPKGGGGLGGNNPQWSPEELAAAATKAAQDAAGAAPADPATSAGAEPAAGKVEAPAQAAEAKTRTRRKAAAETAPATAPATAAAPTADPQPDLGNLDLE